MVEVLTLYDTTLRFDQTTDLAPDSAFPAATAPLAAPVRPHRPSSASFSLFKLTTRRFHVPLGFIDGPFE